jgi:predicted ester cyclase
MRDLIAAEPDYRWEITSSLTDGQQVAAEWTWTATYTGPGPTGPVTNQPVAGRGASFARIENGRIAYFADYYDNASFFPTPAPGAAPR